VLAAVLCAGVLAGCSQEPGAKPVKETPLLSKARFLERGNEICRRSARELDQQSDDVDTSTTAKARRAVRKVIVPSIRDQAADLRELSGPARLERQLEPLLADTDRILDFLVEDPSRYREVDLLFVDVDKGLTSLGLTECGQN
jgi:hypothetical protein